MTFGERVEGRTASELFLPRLYILVSSRAILELESPNCDRPPNGRSVRVSRNGDRLLLMRIAEG